VQETAYRGDILVQAQYRLVDAFHAVEGAGAAGREVAGGCGGRCVGYCVDHGFDVLRRICGFHLGGLLVRHVGWYCDEKEERNRFGSRECECCGGLDFSAIVNRVVFARRCS
jgi:hypothetical protein